MAQNVINRIEQLIRYLEPLLPFCNCHMVDFFTKNNYQEFIPTNIQQDIGNLGTEASLNLILDETTDYNPHYLRKFLSDCKYNTVSSFSDVCLSLNDLQLKLTELGCENSSGLRLKIFMTSKKSHEVEILSEVSSAVTQIAKTNFVVDIGDGKGYLSSILALYNGLKVLGVDSSQVNTNSAEKRLNKLNKILKNRSDGNYKRVTKFVTKNTNLIELIRESFYGDEINKLSLVGLHTCGDLAANCLKIFANNCDVSSICNVGCCYHLLSDEGFPMSNYLKEKRFILQRNAKMLSCQSLNRILYYREMPSKILFYRALLQILLDKYYPNLIDKQVGKIKKSTTFLNYVQGAFKKFDVELTLPDYEINDLYVNYAPMEKYLQVFYLLRAHLAPIIESIILLDRILFLYELNLSDSYLVQLFDPVISPRCFGIISIKQ